MTNSMTGFASGDGQIEGWSWTWDLRSVNSRGLDIRLRVPDWIEGLEPAIRALLQKSAARGSVTLSLRVARADADAGLELDAGGLDAAINLVRTVETRASDLHLGLAPSRATDVLAMRGVLETQSAPQDTSALKQVILADMPGLIQQFNESRAQEGAALETVLRGQIATVAERVADARTLADARSDKMAAALREALARVTEVSDMDEGRIAQELALIAVKADIAEELDRLDAHVAAAHVLLDQAEPKGRKLDFLTQEFNREANTLCSKAQFKDLTAVGLDLKHTIDQMREQVQNVE
ncbi:MAG: YicC family protein [Alphaproteobacteria bacterium]|nr:YicC family protein [Alphaproteobacteria bacterium]NNF25288.1 YicC family protein [Paracoccaceae bacterium]